jgi:hypothetical protein
LALLIAGSTRPPAHPAAIGENGPQAGQHLPNISAGLDLFFDLVGLMLAYLVMLGWYRLRLKSSISV